MSTARENYDIFTENEILMSRRKFYAQTEINRHININPTV